MPSFNPQKARAVLIGTSECPADIANLPPLPAVQSNVIDLARLLRDRHVVGIPHENIVVILNAATPQEVLHRLVQAAGEAEDALLVYYSGHGLVSRDSRELLLVVRTSTDAGRNYDSIHFGLVQRALRDSKAKQKVLILDCCFSGRGLEGLMAPLKDVVEENVNISGVYGVSSSAANLPSIAPPGAGYTAFTGELLGLLENGIEKSGTDLTMGQLFDGVRAGLVKKGFPEPQQANRQDGVKIALALNRYGLGLEDRLLRCEEGLRQRPASSWEESIQALSSKIEVVAQAVDSRVASLEKIVRQLGEERRDKSGANAAGELAIVSRKAAQWEKEKKERREREAEAERSKANFRRMRSIRNACNELLIFVGPALAYVVTGYLVREVYGTLWNSLTVVPFLLFHAFLITIALFATLETSSPRPWLSGIAADMIPRGALPSHILRASILGMILLIIAAFVNWCIYH